MNDDLISRSALEAEFRRRADTYDKELGGDLFHISEIVVVINEAPTVELDESIIQTVLNKRCMTVVTNEHLRALYDKTPRGEWLWLGFDDGNSHKWSCSKCGRGVKEQENFCPNCGLKMQKGVVENEQS